MKSVSKRRTQHQRSKTSGANQVGDATNAAPTTAAPSEAAAAPRASQEIAQRRVVHLQHRVRAKLDDDGIRAFLALEELRNQLSNERESACFASGFERGVADASTLGFAIRGTASLLSPEVAQLADDVRERVSAANLPPPQVLLCLLECVWRLAAMEALRPPVAATAGAAEAPQVPPAPQPDEGAVSQPDA